MEQANETKVVLVKYVCDECKEGQMESTGKVLLSYPAQYEHKCNVCGATMTSFKHYPFLAYHDKEHEGIFNTSPTKIEW